MMLRFAEESKPLSFILGCLTCKIRMGTGKDGEGIARTARHLQNTSRVLKLSSQQQALSKRCWRTPLGNCNCKPVDKQFRRAPDFSTV